MLLALNLMAVPQERWNELKDTLKTIIDKMNKIEYNYRYKYSKDTHENCNNES